MSTLPTAAHDDSIAALIHAIRGHKVMLDSDLARLYRVPTERLIDQLRRNAGRFPPISPGS